MLVTALVPHIGYDARRGNRDGRTSRRGGLREAAIASGGVAASDFDSGSGRTDGAAPRRGGWAEPLTARPLLQRLRLRVGRGACRHEPETGRAPAECVWPASDGAASRAWWRRSCTGPPVPGLRYTSDADRASAASGAGAASSNCPARRPLRDPATLARIRRLAIPPAWTDMWIAPQPQGHVQATGRDAARPQAASLSSALGGGTRCREVLALIAFGAALPALRRRVRHDLAADRVAAAEGARLGGAAARADADPRRQRRVRGAERIVRADDHPRSPRPGRRPAIRFGFRGKSGKMHDVASRNAGWRGW